MPLSVWFICDGIAKLTRAESNGQRAIVGLRRTGWLMGMANVLLDKPYACTAETLTRSRMCIVSKDQLTQAMETNAALNLWISIMFSAVCYKSMFALSDRSSLDARHRVEKFLWEMANSLGACDMEKAIKLPNLLKQWEVAQLLGLTPQHLSRLFGQMETEGLLVRNNGWLILPEPRRLQLSEPTISVFPDCK